MHKKKKKKTLLVCNSPGTSGKVPRGVMVLRFYGTHEKHQSSRGVEVGDGFARNLNDSCVTNSARVPQVTAGDPSFSPVFSCAFLWSSCYCQKTLSHKLLELYCRLLEKNFRASMDSPGTWDCVFENGRFSSSASSVTILYLFCNSCISLSGWI